MALLRPKQNQLLDVARNPRSTRNQGHRPSELPRRPQTRSSLRAKICYPNALVQLMRKT